MSAWGAGERVMELEGRIRRLEQQVDNLLKTIEDLQADLKEKNERIEKRLGEKLK